MRIKYIVCRDTEQDLMNLMGAVFTAVFFVGGSNTTSVQPIVAIERTVLYREKAAGLYSALPYTIGQVNAVILSQKTRQR